MQVQGNSRWGTIPPPNFLVMPEAVEPSPSPPRSVAALGGACGCVGVSIP